MLEIQAITPSYPVPKTKKIHKDEYRMPNKLHRNNPQLEEHEEKEDESAPSQHIDERV
ncbi:MAG: hypothetical protein PHC99_07785 [Methylococcales bacterium]|nr:hypothetical protein [Methylococcales bacterium]